MYLKLDKSFFFSESLCSLSRVCGLFCSVRDSGSFTPEAPLCMASILKVASKSKKAASAPAVGTRFQPGGPGSGRRRTHPLALKDPSELCI